MAKKANRAKKAKRARKAKQEQVEISGVGWVFFVVCFVLLVVPSVILVWVYSYEDKRGSLFPYIVGFVIAALGAGVFSWAVNSVWYWVMTKRLKAKRKKPKKT